MGRSTCPRPDLPRLTSQRRKLGTVVPRPVHPTDPDARCPPKTCTAPPAADLSIHPAGAVKWATLGPLPTIPIAQRPSNDIAGHRPSSHDDRPPRCCSCLLQSGTGHGQQRIRVRARKQVSAQLELLATELASSWARVLPASAAACRHLLTEAVESPLYNPDIPAEELPATIQRIRRGITR
jgi:hypothetical protein